MISTLTGAITLTRRSLRRDRLMIAVWLAALGSVCCASAPRRNPCIPPPPTV